MRADAVLGSLCTRPCAYCKHYRKHTPGPTHCVVAFAGIRVETRTERKRIFTPTLSITCLWPACPAEVLGGFMMLALPVVDEADVCGRFIIAGITMEPTTPSPPTSQTPSTRSGSCEHHLLAGRKRVDLCARKRPDNIVLFVTLFHSPICCIRRALYLHCPICFICRAEPTSVLSGSLTLSMKMSHSINRRSLH